ncbi:dihydrolipoyl dehydrogenase family protein [Chloroflexota bacterium]
MINLDVLIIGGGTAGEYAASYAMGTGRSVGMVERGAIGGACIFNACIPTKAMVHAARMYEKMKNADFYGLPTPKEAADFKNVKAFKDKIIGGIGTGRDERWTKRGVQLFRGNAQFKSPNEVAVGNELIKASKIIITTGSSPIAPPIPGLKEAGFITNIEARELEKVPDMLVIIGGGPIGVEFARVFSVFGARVHIVEALDRILAAEDEETSSAIEDALGKRGIQVSTSAKVIEVKTTASGKAVKLQKEDGSERDLECAEILVSTGRKPNIEEINLSAAGIEAGKRGINVDTSLQTNVPHIWAAGDVTGTFLFTYVAGEQGKTAALNATTGSHTELDYSVLPRATFCDPEVASVGLTEKQAREKGYNVKVGKFDYANLTRAIVSGETEGFIKVIAEENSGRILGGHMVGAEASSLIHEIAAAMAGGVSVSVVGNTLHSYPTLSEGVRYACQATM